MVSGLLSCCKAYYCSAYGCLQLLAEGRGTANDRGLGGSDGLWRHIVAQGRALLMLEPVRNFRSNVACLCLALPCLVLSCFVLMVLILA